MKIELAAMCAKLITPSHASASFVTVIKKIRKKMKNSHKRIGFATIQTNFNQNNFDFELIFVTKKLFFIFKYEKKYMRKIKEN